jgi:XapX domain-containing protein
VKEFIVQSALSLGTGLITGFVFAAVKLGVPAPNAIPPIFGILGITLGYMVYQYYFG